MPEAETVWLIREMERADQLFTCCINKDHEATHGGMPGLSDSARGSSHALPVRVDERDDVLFLAELGARSAFLDAGLCQVADGGDAHLWEH